MKSRDNSNKNETSFLSENTSSDSVITAAISMPNTTDMISPSAKETIQQIGPYKVLKLLGKGGMGEVFLCSDTRKPGSPKVAVKRIFSNLLSDPEMSRRFDAEAKLLESISHAAVVGFYECGTFETEGHKSRYIVMEYVEGISLYILCRERRLSFPDILKISVQLANGLQAIHNAQVIHRDLKPGNIIVTKDGVAKIIDFGIAKPALMGRANSEDTSIGFQTQTGIVIGTANYIAPEVLKDQPASVSSDVYALGLIIWEMINGQVPFRSAGIQETMKRVMTEQLTWATGTRSLAPEGFLNLVDRMISKIPSARPPTAGYAASEMDKIGRSPWVGGLARDSRFELDIRWAPATIARIKKQDIDESEVGFVLQDIEDQLVVNNDPRLLGKEAIDINTGVINNVVPVYRRLRLQTINLRRPQPAAGLPKATNSNSIKIKEPRPFGKYAAIVCAVIAVAVMAKKFDATVPRDGLKTFTAALDRARTEVGFFIQDISGRTVSSAEVRQPATFVAKQKIEPKIGRVLTYRITTTTAVGGIVASEEVREIKQLSEKEILWDVGGLPVNTSRSFFPAEVYFHPTFQSSTAASESLSAVGFLPLTAGRTTHVELTNAETKSVEKLACTPIHSRATVIEKLTHEIWKIDCNRQVFREGQRTHLVTESYQYSTTIEAVVAVELKMTTLSPRGPAGTSVFRLDLQLGGSKL